MQMDLTCGHVGARRCNCASPAVFREGNEIGGHANFGNDRQAAASPVFPQRSPPQEIIKLKGSVIPPPDEEPGKERNVDFLKFMMKKAGVGG